MMILNCMNAFKTTSAKYNNRISHMTLEIPYDRYEKTIQIAA
jgi:hypothetical protein